MYMIRLFFSLILSVLTVAATASDFIYVQNPDSAALFENITDISRQIEQRANSSRLEVPADTINPITVKEERVPVTLPDSVPSVVIPEQPKPQVQPTPAAIPVLTSYRRIPYLPDSLSLIRRNHLDSLYNRKNNGTLQLPDSYFNADAMRGLSFRDTLFYNPLFLPMIFKGNILPRNLSFYSPEEEQTDISIIPEEETFAPWLQKIDFVHKIRKNYYTNYPDRVKYSVYDFENVPSIAETDEVVREIFNPFRELLQSETAYSLEAPGVDLTTIDRKYWVRSGEHSFQFAQNYFSENWHKGGTNNLNFNSYHVLRANYKKDKVKFNNTLEWRLSVFNAPDDSLRKYRIGNDLIRYYGDFGIDAFAKGWTYSMNIEAKSQLFNAYPTNSSELRSALLSPLYINAGVGLGYALEKSSDKVRHRKIKWDLAIAPVSVNFRYVANDSVDVVRYGIPEGDKSLLDLGTTITSILKYDITKYITWDSRLTYFTSYDKVISEFENSLNMALSNAFSTRIYLNVRFDDSVPADPSFNYWQVNQTLSFGLNYKW